MTTTETTPTAWDLGYADGRRKQLMWRKILKPEYFEEYDKGFYAGQLAAVRKAQLNQQTA